MRRTRGAQVGGAQGQSPPEVVQQSEEPSADSFVIQDDSNSRTTIHSSDCLTQKRVSEATAPWAMVATGQVYPTEHHSTQEVVDGQTSLGCIPEKSGEGEVIASATNGSSPGDLDGDLVALGSVLSTVAQVRAVLDQFLLVERTDFVLWGCCARCGHEGQIVHFDGVLRARRRAP